MKTILHGAISSVVVVVLVALVTVLAYFLTGGSTSRGLSDWLVYASFATLTVGTFLGIGKVGYKGKIYADDVWAERMLHEFFRAGLFPVALVVGGVACFLVAIVVDGLF